MTNKIIKKAKECFYQKKYKQAFDIFAKIDGYCYEAGLCALILEDIQSAKKMWKKDKNNNPASNFGLTIIDFITYKKKTVPTFFQTRAFLEIFLNLFLENNLISWAENLLTNNEYFAKSNPEAFKFIARALFANGYFDLAIVFCNKSITICNYDPEALMILAQCMFLKGDNAQALDVINKSLIYAPDYYPSKLLRSIVFEVINNKK